MKTILAITMTAAALAVASCSEPIVANQNPYLPQQVTIESYWLRGELYVKALPTERISGSGQLKVPLEIYNKTDWDKSIDYQCTFVDKSGSQVDSEPVWQHVKVPKRGVAQIAPMSMSAQAEDFRLLIRLAQ